jgi:vancomycin resistance protein YoaR
MSENLKTIKELAEELGVSKTAINKKVTERERKLWFSKIGNKFVINERGQKVIKSMFEKESGRFGTKNENLKRKPETKTENSQNDSGNNLDIKYILDIIEYQKEQISDLQRTKDEQFKQLSTMQNLLDQQQRLALQDKKIIEDYKSEINDLRALNMPMNRENDPSVNNDQEELAQLKLKIKVLEEHTNSEEKETGKIEPKKWWRLWK